MLGLQDLVEARSLEIVKNHVCVVDSFEMLRMVLKETPKEAQELERELEKIALAVRGEQVLEDSEPARRLRKRRRVAHYEE
jgi:hypothetical protein